MIRFRFTLRELLLLTVIAAMALGWGLDRSRAAKQKDRDAQLRQLFVSNQNQSIVISDLERRVQTLEASQRASVTQAKSETAAPPAEPISTWGHLQGQFIYEGPPPATRYLHTFGAQGNQQLIDESLLVHGETRGIANVVVYLRTKAPPVHPDYERFPPTVKLVIAGGRIKPHVATIRLDQRLRIQNLDAVAYNPNISPVLDAADNPQLPPGNVFERPEFIRSQAIPQPISCNIHPWIRAYVLPRDNPYVAISSDLDGRFEIRNLPIGDHEFQVWHERVGYLTVEPELVKGRLGTTIRPNVTTDLGQILISPSVFERVP